MTPYYQDDKVTLYHGDSLDVVAGLAAESVDMVFTDPPYGHNNNNNGDLIHRIEVAIPNRRPKNSVRKPGEAEAARPILNDGAEANEIFQAILPILCRVLVKGACCCCCCGGPDPQFARWSLWLDQAIGFKQMVIWDKGPMGMGWHYRRSYETVLVAEKPGAACRWFDTTNAIENVIRHIRKIIPSAEQHPTVKPPALAAHFIRLHSREGDTVLDPFAGSGTTLIAARRLGRKAIGIELDERFCEMAARALADEARPNLFDCMEAA